MSYYEACVARGGCFRHRGITQHSASPSTVLNWKCQPFFFFVCSLSKDALAQVQHLFSQESEVCTTSSLLHRPTLGVRGVREGMKVSRVLAVSGDRPCSAHLSLSRLPGAFPS